MAFPTTDMPGHRRLQELVSVAIGTGYETPEVEFKESAPWQVLEWRIIRTLLGMANLPWGGFILIGASERGDEWDFSGMTDEHFSTYDVDHIAARVDRYASPSVACQSVVHKKDDVFFLVIAVGAFDEVPIVCKKDGPEGSGLHEGEVYVRPPGLPRTERVSRAQQMHDLLESAAERRARRILETSRRLGLTPTSPPDEDQFTKELGGL
jgi:hypothetical protein